MLTRIVGLASTTLSHSLSQVSVFHTASSFCKSSNIIRIAVITINNNEIINFIYIRIKIFPPLPTTHPAKSTMPLLLDDTHSDPILRETFQISFRLNAAPWNPWQLLNCVDEWWVWKLLGGIIPRRSFQQQHTQLYHNTGLWNIYS